ncbi:uncharacterized protein NMK_2379 [Novimethylophilus kurashikiensis]|uniref:TRASH domain-containing protein n=2 Tax=Novimethylophilus kurashikiensis TaxID=1825523 RepID=A0A2R5FB53_9PROT|nr:uncharacterized protein NMK_2379 [Novimethylophilus kurashikiensis]
MAIDLVCKMNVKENEAAATEKMDGQVYYFCSESCHTTFKADPQKYIGEAKSKPHSCCGGH